MDDALAPTKKAMEFIRVGLSARTYLITGRSLLSTPRSAERTMRSSADVAIADAASFRACGTLLAAAQSRSLDRSFTYTDFSQTDNDLSLLLSPTVLTRDKIDLGLSISADAACVSQLKHDFFVRRGANRQSGCSRASISTENRPYFCCDQAGPARRRTEPATRKCVGRRFESHDLERTLHRQA